MPIAVGCTCGQQFQVRDEFAGQCVQCPCGQVLTVPMPMRPAGVLPSAPSRSAVSSRGPSLRTRAAEDEPPPPRGSAAPWVIAGIFVALVVGCGAVLVGLATMNGEPSPPASPGPE